MLVDTEEWRREMRRVRLVCCVGLIIAGLLSVAPASSASSGRIPAQQTTTHVVQPGQNLFRIALRYGTTVDAIMAANGLSNHTIYVGQRLVIPGGSSGSGSSGSSGSNTLHVVQPGDTLTRIGLQYGVTMGALQQANQLASPNLIYVGQRLVIPGGGSGGSSSGGSSGSAGGSTYTVRVGDTLSGIAARFGTTAGALASANGIVNPSLIRVGHVLQVPAGGSVSPALPASGSKQIIIDLSDQHLYAYQGGQMVYSFIASTGRAGASTYPGEYRVQSKIPRAYGGTWNIWMPYWLGIYWAGSLENGIHALPVTPGGQVVWAEYLGRPISFGCIVLGTEAARLLYNWAPIGTPVSIRW